LRIRWHGHACFEIAGSTVVVTDPHDGKSLGIPAPDVRADIVLVSHQHTDHNCDEVVRGDDCTVIKDPLMTFEKGVRVEGIEASHDDHGGAKRGAVTLFKFDMDGVKFCHLGDLGHIPDDDQTARIDDVDFLFVPVGDVYTVGPVAAKKIIDKVRPKVAIPMHYRVPGLSLSIKPVGEFTRLFDDAVIVNVGNEVDFSSEDMPSGPTEIWVFSK
jgi:L-ascorbate metabolism protein UlaG (beta-lactamase superfamily)